MATTYERPAILTNPNSTQAHEQHVQSFIIAHPNAVRIETVNGHFETNVRAVAEQLRDHDRLISIGGDGTGHIAANAIMQAKREGEVRGVQLAFYPAGGFCDQAATFTRGRQDWLFDGATTTTKTIYPLDISVDDEHLRYGLLYASLGWTALATEEYNGNAHRSNIKRFPRLRGGLSLLQLAGSYRDLRIYGSKAPLPAFKRPDNPKGYHPTDVLALNGPIACGFIRSHVAYYASPHFLSHDLDVRSVLANRRFLGRSAVNFALGSALPLGDITRQHDTLDFGEQVAAPMQVDGEAFRVYGSRVTIGKQPDASLQVVVPKRRV